MKIIKSFRRFWFSFLIGRALSRAEEAQAIANESLSLVRRLEAKRGSL